MRYPAYLDYTPTRWPEVGSIPSGWEARRLKFAVTCNDEALSETTDSDYEIAYVDISSVDLVNGITAVETLSFDEAPSRARRIVRDGDTIVSTVRTYLKAIAPIEAPPGNMIVSTGFAVIRPLEFVNSRFLGYVLQNTAFIDEVVAHSTGVSYPAINPTTLVCLPVRYPGDKTEQQQIAAFLDWKTGQINALIAKKQELLEKLKENRLAVITQAVTKGLSSAGSGQAAAPLRDSGIPWLGQVPKHWEVKRLRFATGRIEQGWSPQCDNQPADDEAWGVMKVGCVNGDEFDSLENKALPLDLEPMPEYELRPKDILISRANTKELLGSAAIVPENVRPKLLLCDKLFRLRPTAGVDEEFLTCYLRTPAARYQYEREATGSSGSMQNIGQSTIKNLVVFLPPLGEQKVIFQYIQREVAKLDALVNKVQTVVDRLTEYRTALITAATTGKIDVRQVAVPSLA
ncbi:MAG: restriction endonuclease subunit S [Pseudomonadota bacterium]